MASKLGLAGGIPERRVRPIWDAVDSRQYKAALKLCAALLPKYPNSPYALALKALVLERMGKPEEALNVCLNAREQLLGSDIIHMDDLTLSTLQMVLQRLNRLDLATSCYEHACGKYPNNLELMMGLFNCYVREYSYVKQQQTAIKMYKIVGEERFLLWAVCSILLQVSCGNAGDKLLPLAEALVKKHMATYSLHEPEALLVYISIMERQAKYGAAFEIISGSLGSLLPIEVDKYRIQGRLLARAGDYVAGVDIFQKVLELCPDDWESFLHYLGCLLEELDMTWSEEIAASSLVFKGNGVHKHCHLSDDEFEERIAIASSFVKKLQTEVDGDSVRCPYLASIEIEKRQRLYGRANNRRLMEALMEYFSRFSCLSCFTSDVEIFVDVLSHEEGEELLGNFKKAAESMSLSPLQELGQAVNFFRIKELFSSTLKQSVCQLKDDCFDMVDMFCKKLSLSRELDPQENIHGEELLTMASNSLVQLFWRTGHVSYLLEAIMLLEFGLTIGRHAWQYKILLLHLYSHLGALPLSYEWYGSLDVKNIMLETMSHHIMPQMLKSTLWTELSALMRDYLKFMDDYMREAADHTFVAYRHRNYTKVVEFVLFKEKLQNSAQYSAAKVESAILELKQKADNLQDVECALEKSDCGAELLLLTTQEKLNALTFNQDLQSRPWWSPSPDVNLLLEPYDGNYYRQKLPVGEDDDVIRKTLKRRSLLPRLLYLSVNAVASSVKENANANGPSPPSSRDQGSSELESLLEQYSATLGLPFKEAAETVIAISEHATPLEELALDLPTWMSFAVFLNAHHLGRERRRQRESYSGSVTWTTVDNLIRRCVAEGVDSSKAKQPELTGDLPVLVQLITEACSWHGLIIQACLRSAPQPSSGKKKKKSGGPSDQPAAAVTASHVIRASIEALYAAVEEVKRWLGGHLSAALDDTVDATLAALRSGGAFRRVEELASGGDPEVGERISQALQSWDAADVARRFQQGRRSALTEFQRICDVKLRRLDSLRAAAAASWC